MCTWLREISSCSCLTVLPDPAWVLLSKTYKPLFPPLYYINFLIVHKMTKHLFIAYICSSTVLSCIIAHSRSLFRVMPLILFPRFVSGKYVILPRHFCSLTRGVNSSRDWTVLHGCRTICSITEVSHFLIKIGILLHEAPRAASKLPRGRKCQWSRGHGV